MNRWASFVLSETFTVLSNSLGFVPSEGKKYVDAWTQVDWIPPENSGHTKRPRVGEDEGECFQRHCIDETRNEDTNETVGQIQLIPPENSGHTKRPRVGEAEGECFKRHCIDETRNEDTNETVGQIQLIPQ